jgi:hypothetical protein
MKSLYLLGFSLLGGLVSLFASAGWSSYKHQKIPERGVLFRWFVAGVVAVGLGAYVWIFGANGDVQQMMGQMTNALDITTFTKLASMGTLLAGGGAALKNAEDASGAMEHAEGVQQEAPELTVGMPTF